MHVHVTRHHLARATAVVAASALLMAGCSTGDSVSTPAASSPVAASQEQLTPAQHAFVDLLTTDDLTAADEQAYAAMQQVVLLSDVDDNITTQLFAPIVGGAEIADLGWFFDGASLTPVADDITLVTINQGVGSVEPALDGDPNYRGVNLETLHFTSEAAATRAMELLQPAAINLSRPMEGAIEQPINPRLEGYDKALQIRLGDQYWTAVFVQVGRVINIINMGTKSTADFADLINADIAAITAGSRAAQQRPLLAPQEPRLGKLTGTRSTMPYSQGVLQALLTLPFVDASAAAAAFDDVALVQAEGNRTGGIVLRFASADQARIFADRINQPREELVRPLTVPNADADDRCIVAQVSKYYRVICTSVFDEMVVINDAESPALETLTEPPTDAQLSDIAQERIAQAKDLRQAVAVTGYLAELQNTSPAGVIDNRWPR
ncbi:hypothetical protein ACFPVT_00050 [Corynebacterium choanae]|uniref:Secreted protein n=1 Tax=Corynebacterium choanae TaxID=1862358 RepID=A0A3G6J5R5_9CORY|nr:hypothetical protein [Corynebacterium choanae]AZA13103.1 hypothetical protein CCHOA_03460 [Corynebacterium choanae]